MRRGLAASLLLTLILLAGTAFGQGSMNAAGSSAHWDATDTADEVVLLFGSMLAVLCLYNLIALGIHTMSGGRYKRSKRRRRG